MPGQASWDLYRSFLAVIQHGSFSAAARMLDLTQPTVGRHIAELQALLDGKPLFTRSPTGLTPTAAAHELRPHAESMAAAVAAFQRAATGEPNRVAGVVRVTASEVIGIEVLPPILAKLRNRYRGLEIELVLSNAMADLLRRDADIAVRLARPQQKSLLARRVGTIALGMHAHRRYLEAHGVPTTDEDLDRHTLIGFDHPPQFLQRYKVGVELKRERFAFRTDNDTAQLAAIRAGVGIGVCQYGLARRDPDLVNVVPDLFRMNLETWIVMHADQRKARHVKTVFDEIYRGVADYAATSAAPAA